MRPTKPCKCKHLKIAGNLGGFGLEDLDRFEIWETSSPDLRAGPLSRDWRFWVGRSRKAGPETGAPELAKRI